MNGEFDIMPLLNGNRSGCDYCPYGAVCGFDEKSCSYSTFEHMDKKTVKVNSEDRRYIAEGSREGLDTMVKFKYNQTRQLAGMVNIVVREYANAYKDKVRMTREVIRKALYDGKTDSNMADADKKDDDD